MYSNKEDIMAKKRTTARKTARRSKKTTTARKTKSRKTARRSKRATARKQSPEGLKQATMLVCLNALQ